MEKVDGEKYIGQGRSKKLARIQAAEAALRNFIQFKDGMALSPVKSTNSMDFTSDDHIDTGIPHHNWRNSANFHYVFGFILKFQWDLFSR